MWATGAYGYVLDYLAWYVALVSVILHTWCFFRLFPPDKAPRLRLLCGNLMMGVCFLVAAGLVAETYLRFLSVETDAMGTSLTAKRWHKAYARLNSQYFRDREWSVEKPPGVYRIAVLGDSFVYGWGINDPKDRFTDLLQARFDAAGRQVEVMNFGWSDWDTRQEFRGLQNIVGDYSPDEVVLCYLTNDIAPLTGASEQVPRSHWINPEVSFLFDWIWHRFWGRDPAIAERYYSRIYDAHFDPKLWEAQRQSLDQIVDWCRKRGIRLRVAILPLLKTTGTYDAQKLHAQVAAYFESRGVQVLDLLPAICGLDADRLIVNRYDPHPNELANQIFADALWTAFYAQPRP